MAGRATATLRLGDVARIGDEARVDDDRYGDDSVPGGGGGGAICGLDTTVAVVVSDRLVATGDACGDARGDVCGDDRGDAYGDVALEDGSHGFAGVDECPFAVGGRGGDVTGRTAVDGGKGATGKGTAMGFAAAAAVDARFALAKAIAELLAYTAREF